MANSNRFFSAFLVGGVLLLAGCGSWSSTEYGKRERIFDQPSVQLGPLNNAVIRYKNIAAVMTEFPDAMQTMDQICLRGLPNHHGHLRNWHAKNENLLEKIGSAVRMDGYRLRNTDLLMRDRVSQLMRISNLLFVEAAFNEQENKFTDAAQQILRSRRLANQMMSDGGMQDIQVGHLIHYRSMQFLDRLLSRLPERILQEVIVETEYGLRLYRKSFAPSKSLARLAPMHAIEFLKPMPGDSAFDSWSMPSASALTGECSSILEIWRACEKIPLKTLVQGDGDKKLVNQLDKAHEFTQAFFGHGSARGIDRPMTGLVRSQVHAATVQVRDEMIQLKAAALIHYRIKKVWPATIEELQSNVEVCHGTLGKQSLKRLPARPDAFKDPFSEKAYGYRISGVEALMWSAGPDFNDDAGLEPWDGSKRGDIIKSLKP